MLASQRNEGRRVVQAKPTKRGNAFFFGLTLLGVIVFAGAGLYYLVPNFYHPFTSDTPHQTYAHFTIAAGLFVGAVLCLILAGISRPGNSETLR
jgi:hypothetical protein